MLQLFFKPSAIDAKEWEVAYLHILSIVIHFPLKLLRVESYKGYEAYLDKDHFELRENIGSSDESLAFYGDWMSYTSGTTIRFYKNWEKHFAEELDGEEKDSGRPITWFPHYPFRNDGSLPQANGVSTKYGYIDTEGAAYEYAILAIAIMLENQLPGRVFLTAMNQHPENIEDVVAWLTAHFERPFDLPLYFDKKRLLDSFIQEYQYPSQAVCRMEHLFRNQYKRNMAFAIENIGYQAAFDCYADILSSNTFGTFGFADVLDPWIAVTQDLESTLDLIAKSKQLTEDRGNEKGARAYDLVDLLESFLNKFILWTPQQREELKHFYTSEEALETGNESLWGIIYRMTGNRVDICPLCATPSELFEAFMYHSPKDAQVFKKVIDEWIENNADGFDRLKQKLIEAQSNLPEQKVTEEKIPAPELAQTSFLKQFLPHERPFLELVLHLNPVFAGAEAEIQDILHKLREFVALPENQAHINQIRSNSRDANIAYIRRRIKRDIQCRTHPLFEQWLEEEKDENVLFYLTLLISLKFHTRSKAYLRYRILWDRIYWEGWRE